MYVLTYVNVVKMVPYLPYGIVVQNYINDTFFIPINVIDHNLSYRGINLQSYDSIITYFQVCTLGLAKRYLWGLVV